MRSRLWKMKGGLDACECSDNPVYFGLGCGCGFVCGAENAGCRSESSSRLYRLQPKMFQMLPV